MHGWDAVQYEKFIIQRTLPARHLADSIDVKAPAAVLDLGCGTGNSTALLCERFPDARVIGADNSGAMLEAAERENPGPEYLYLDVGRIDKSFDGRFDVVFSNACLQWLPDHSTLFPRLMRLLRGGGQLLVQMPVQAEHLMYRCVIPSVTESLKWADSLPIKRDINVLSREEYFDILSRETDDFEIWQTTYCHRLPDCESVVEWYKGTGLRPYLAQLDERLRDEFLRDIFRAAKAVYKPMENGEIMFEFPRLFIKAKKKES